MKVIENKIMNKNWVNLLLSGTWWKTCKETLQTESKWHQKITWIHIKEKKIIKVNIVKYSINIYIFSILLIYTVTIYDNVYTYILLKIEIYIM